MPTCAEYRTLLTAAQAGLSTSLLGGQVVEVRTSSDKVLKFAPGNLDALRRYVFELQSKVDACDGVPRRSRFIRCIPTDC